MRTNEQFTDEVLSRGEKYIAKRNKRIKLASTGLALIIVCGLSVAVLSHGRLSASQSDLNRADASPPIYQTADDNSASPEISNPDTNQADSPSDSPVLDDEIYNVIDETYQTAEDLPQGDMTTASSCFAQIEYVDEYTASCYYVYEEDLIYSLADSIKDALSKGVSKDSDDAVFDGKEYYRIRISLTGKETQYVICEGKLYDVTGGNACYALDEQSQEMLENEIKDITKRR